MILPTPVFVGLNTTIVSDIAATVSLGVCIQDFLIETGARNSDPVATTNDGCCIHHKKNALASA